MAQRIKVSALALVLLGSGVLAVCGDRLAAEPLTNELTKLGLTNLTGGWNAKPLLDSNGKLEGCVAVRLLNKDGVVFGVFASPEEGRGVMLIKNSWQLDLSDKTKSVDVTFDAKAQYHVSAEVNDKQSLLIRMQGDEMVAQFRKAYALSILFEGQHFDFSLAGTFRLFPVLTDCVRTSGITRPATAPTGLHASDVTPQSQAEKDCFQKADADRKIAACSQLLARGVKVDAHHRFAYYFNRSKAYNVKRQYDSALADLDAASVLDPENEAVFYGRAEVYRRKGELDRALTNYDASILRSPRGAVAYFGRGQTYLRKGELERALGDFNSAVRNDPKSSEAYSGRGQVYLRQGNYDRALTEYDEVIRLDPMDSDAYLDRAEVHMRRGDYEIAIKDAEQAIRLDPKWPDPHDILGRVYLYQGNYGRALAEYDEAIRLDSSDSFAYGFRAIVHARRGDYEIAIADAERAVRLKPKDASPHAILAFAFAKTGDFGRAQSEIDDAFRLDSKDVNAFLYRGEIYLLKREPQLALKDFEDALALRPDSVFAKAGREAAQQALAAPIAPPSTAVAPAPAAVAPMPTRPADAAPVALRPDATSDSMPTFYGDENVDFKVLPQNTLQGVVRKETPLAIPGAATVTTIELKKAMDVGRPMVLIDVMGDEHAITINGAVPLPYAGIFGTFHDQVQTRLANALSSLLQGRTDVPLVFFCTGVKRWESYNAALRAHAAGFQNVSWYRGGLAAWKEAGFPMQAKPTEN
jgi:tetratricopeptide (TPR) repeat protein/rhodanese-related sulfurtransferase